MKTLYVAILFLSVFFIGLINKKINEPKPLPIMKMKPIESVYIYRKSENKNTNYLEKEDSLNLLNQ
jgi:hypothetical protein